MKEIERKVYVCEGCGCIHADEQEIMIVNGTEFCTDCVDSYRFYDDDTYGIIVLPKENFVSIVKI